MRPLAPSYNTPNRPGLFNVFHILSEKWPCEKRGYSRKKRVHSLYRKLFCLKTGTTRDGEIILYRSWCDLTKRRNALLHANLYHLLKWRKHFEWKFVSLTEWGNVLKVFMSIRRKVTATPFFWTCET